MNGFSDNRLNSRRAPAFVNAPACQPKPWRRLVEAAGVEPASEMACHDKTTCVSDSKSQSRPQNRQEGTEPSLIEFKSAAPGGGFGPILQKDAGPEERRHPTGGGHLKIRQRRQTACYWQLLFFQSFYGSLEPGTPHHINSIPSIPLRPLISRIHPHGTALSAFEVPRRDACTSRRSTRLWLREHNRERMSLSANGFRVRH